MGVKIEDEVDLPNIPRLGAKHGLKTGLARAQVKLPGNRKEMATGANAEWQLVGGRRDTVQVSTSLIPMACHLSSVLLNANATGNPASDQP